MLAWQAAAMILVRVPGFLYDLYVFFPDVQFLQTSTGTAELR